MECFFLVLEENFGLPMGESNFEDDDSLPNDLISKEINLRLPLRPLCIYKCIAVEKTVLGSQVLCLSIHTSSEQISTIPIKEL